MISTARMLRRYDHRLRDLVRSAATSDTRLDKCSSLHRSRLARPARAAVVTVDIVDMVVSTYSRKCSSSRRRRTAGCIAPAGDRVVESVWRLARLRPAPRCGGEGLAASSRPPLTLRLPLRAVLRVLWLSQSRYRSWKRKHECGLDDMPSCPRSSPQQLTQAEVETIKEMVTSDEYRHVPTGALVLLRQRLGKVFASPTTWLRLVRLL